MPAQYYFDELAPAAFQRLINSLLVKRYGEGVRLLPLKGADGGRDLPEAQVHDPLVQGVFDRCVEQPGFRLHSDHP